MERINQFSLYTLGKTLGALTNRVGPVPRQDAFFPLMEAQRDMGELVAGRPFPLSVSHADATTAVILIDSIVDQYYKERNESGELVFRFPQPGDEPIPEWRWGQLRNTIGAFEQVFSAEMRENTTYYVPRRGIFDTAFLVDYADATFPPKLAAFIPEKARVDWKAAGRCLAFNLPSAAGYHVCRAVEGVLETYYQFFAKKPGATLRGWHDYHKALESLKDQESGPSEKALAELDQMRSDYRNALAHPRVVLSDVDARMLFANGESLIILLAQELCVASEASLAPAASPTAGSK